MKVLVIGGAGYIGSVLTRNLLAEGHDVTVLDSLMFGGESLLTFINHKKFKLVKGDLRDRPLLEQTIEGHEAIVLLAAIVGEPACNRDPKIAESINLHGTRTVLELSQKLGVKRFVFTSTCSNYGTTNSEEYVTEEAELQPISTYAKTKVIAESDILNSAAEEFCTTVLRLSTAFGISPRMRFDLLVSDFTLAAKREKEISIYGEQFWRPFVHVEDISTAIELVLESEFELVSGEVFNVGCNEANIQKFDLAKTIKGRLPDVELHLVKREFDPRSYRVDFSKIHSCLNYAPSWSIKDGIEELIDAIDQGIWADTKDARFYN